VGLAFTVTLNEKKLGLVPLKVDPMANKPNTSLDYAVRKSFGRSAITNGTVELDARSKIARRFRDICSAIYSDQGGEEHASEMRLQLIRRFSAACCMVEAMEARMAAGEKIRIDEHALLSNTLVKIAARIGIDRRSRNVTPTLRDYLDQVAEDEPTSSINDTGPDEAIEQVEDSS
jgi:hypothetical protein